VTTKVYGGRIPKHQEGNLSAAHFSSEISEVRGVAETPNWYAIYTRPSHEKRVVEHFALREIECYLPSYRTTRRWKNRCKVELELPLFPGYVFARFQWCRHVRVLEVPSVVSIVGNGREPLSMQDAELESLRAGLVPRRAEPHPYLNIGERARIKSGLLAGFEGIVERQANGLRLVLTVQQIMKSVAVEVEECDLELLGNL
jgi:transcription antitermination factor NusG